MTDEEINIAVAECCGWKDCQMSESWGGAIIGTLGVVGGSNYAKIPNYCNDLNAKNGHLNAASR